MISFFLIVFYNILVFPLNLMPTGGVFPTEVHSAFTTLGSYLGVLDVFVPLDLLIFALLAVFGVEIAIFGFKIVRWIINHIPFIGSGHNE